MADLDLVDHLHSEIDAMEAIRNTARREVLRIWKTGLKPAIDSAQGDGEHQGSQLTEAMQFIAGAVAARLNEITSAAMQQGAKNALKLVQVDDS